MEGDEVVTVEEVSPLWLTRVLREAGHLDGGRVTAVEKRVVLSPGGSLARLALEYDRPQPALPRRMLLKTSRPGSSARGGKEVRFYTSLAPRSPGVPLARCYSAALAPEDGRFHVLLEDASTTHYAAEWPLPPSAAACALAVDSLAELHAAWWQHPELAALAGPLPDARRAHSLASWLERTLPRFADHLGDRLSARRRGHLERLAAAARALEARALRDRPATLVHGDAHLRNFLFPRNAGSHPALLVDWASWGVEFAGTDLAYLIAVHWFPERRALYEVPLLHRYHDRLQASGVCDFDWSACWTGYREAVVRSLIIPVWQWHAGLPATVWWYHLERVMCAYEDLDGVELLDA